MKAFFAFCFLIAEKGNVKGRRRWIVQQKSTCPSEMLSIGDYFSLEHSGKGNRLLTSRTSISTISPVL